MLVMQLKR